MSYTLTFGKTKKYALDTSQYMTDTRTEQVTLKDNVDIKAPIFTVNFDPSNYNYVSWARNNGPTRYYRIDHSVHVHANYYDVYLSLDIMATYFQLIQHCLTGRLLYATSRTYWDEYFDDLRFSPSSLDVYDDFGWGDANDNWLSEHANILGNAANTWDVTYDASGNIVSYGDGCYIVGVTTNLGPRTYIMSTTQFGDFLQGISSTFSSGIANWFEDVPAMVKFANWVPMVADNILSKIGSGNYNLEQVRVGNSPILNSNGYRIPNWCFLTYDGAIVVPQNPAQAPIWMENNRWNKALLQTCTGTTELNLDMMYPRGAHNRIQFSTVFDVTNAVLNTKFTYDVKNHWSNLKGSQIYESNLQIGIDSMNLVQKYLNLTEAAVKAGLVGLALTGGAVAGGMALGAAGGGAGIVKMSAMAHDFPKATASALLKGTGKDVVNVAAIEASRATADVAPLAKTVIAGAAVTRLLPQTNVAQSTIQSSNSLASFYNTNQLGVVSVRFKPLRCKELAYTINGDEPIAKYYTYCNKFGYPSNQMINNLYTQGELNTFYVFEDARLMLNSYNGDDLQGITDEEMSAIIEAAKIGFWYKL